MLATLIPMFDREQRVSAYSIFSQKANLLLNPAYQGYGINDGAGNINGLDIIQAVGLDTLSLGSDVFVPVNKIAVFSDIESACKVQHDRIVLLFDDTITPTAEYIERLKALKDAGFKLALRKLKVSEYTSYAPIISLMDIILLNTKNVDVLKAKIYFGHLFPKLMLSAGNIDNKEMFDKLRCDKAFSMFEGSFYRLPVTKGRQEVMPLKVNYIKLLELVNNPDFDLTKAADIISHDTALTVSLLDIVNHMSINSKITSIRHAAAMLGQRELKKWINVAVTKELCADRPDEITRISLLRAKFVEQLATLFHMEVQSQELFLMGLFSVLDLILEMPMDEALKRVNVSKQITQALVEKKGDFAPVLDFMLRYEDADWQELSRQVILLNISTDAVYDAYISSLVWYRDLFKN